VFLHLLIFGNQVRDIPCGTKGRVMISFDKIEVCISYLYSCIDADDPLGLISLLSVAEVLIACIFMIFKLLQVVNRLRKEHVCETL